MKHCSLTLLLKDLVMLDPKWEREITGLSLDSRNIKPGELFVACNGAVTDGRNYIEMAIQNGAVAVVAEAGDGFPSFSEYASKRESPHKMNLVPIFAIEKLAQYVGMLAARFYHEPTKALRVVGITGTNGKSSVCHYLAEALGLSGKKVGTIGTLGVGLEGNLRCGTHTTPDAITLQGLLANMRGQAVQDIIMEVSSHGLSQNRVNYVDFNIAVFTNLSRDHLDYHGTMDAYAKAKRQLFTLPNLKYAVINIDDEFGRQLLNEFKGKLKLYAYSSNGRTCEQQIPQVRTQQVKLGLQGTTASVHTPWGHGVLHSTLIGRFNLSNVLAVLTCLGIMGFTFEDMLNYVAQLKNVPGRMALFGGNHQPYVIVDYAHTPDALQQSLSALREYCEHELWCVFGCGGNRDRGKRSQMGICAENYADHVVITDDNPRYEDPQRIVADILQGMLKPEFAVVEHDRRRAIAHAISCAADGDIILVAGKGHEKYQIRQETNIPFNDELEVQMLLTENKL